MKCCLRCGALTDQFYRDKRKSDGLQSWCKPCKSSYQVSYYAENSVGLSAKRRAYRAKDRAYHNNWQREWVRKNPETAVAIDRCQRARRRSQAAGGIDGATLRDWTVSQQKTCFYCEADCDSSFHVDHFVPLSKGGGHVLTNLRIACPPCNLRKNASDPLEWIDSL